MGSYRDEEREGCCSAEEEKKWKPSSSSPSFKRKPMSARTYRSLLTKMQREGKASAGGTTPSLNSGNGFSTRCSPSTLQRVNNDSQGQGEKKLDTMHSPCIAEGNLDHLKGSLESIQNDSVNSTCFVCKKTEPHLYCAGKGCKKAYHLSCLDLPLSDDPPGLWLCFCCLRKKMERAHSVSEGIEAVWDIKEEMQKGKHYLVKYKGLAHVHNRWIPESDLRLEDPMLLDKFKKRQKNKLIKWKHQWTEPHRLLRKRFMVPPVQADERLCEHSNFEYCYHEWFVKWKGLGYEHATWEFENSSFLQSSEARALINDYERRQQEAKRASGSSETEKVFWLKKNPFHKHSRLPDGFPSELNNDYLDSLDRLLEFWHKGRNAVLIDGQERIVKTVLFILSLQSYKCQPFLIISTISSISTWEAEFASFAPSINVVVYSGTINDRKTIRKVEFYEESGCIVFQVLLADVNVIVEDLDSLDCIGWEAIIVDNCQSLAVSKHFEQFKHLSSDFRLLLLRKPLKDNLGDYLNMLSFLDPVGHNNPVNSLKVDPIDSSSELDILKERLGQYLACGHKINSTFYLEYWVPVQFSYVQLEQYCGILKSKSDYLSSGLRADECDDDVVVLLDTLISVRKCCSHPYLADESLQFSLAKTRPQAEYLDMGVNASGKLKLLDRILQEMKTRKLRALILFQSTLGSGRNSMAYILDDFLLQRFGADSYVNVDKHLKMSERQAILQKFNNKHGGTFVVLIESRACRPSFKLASVDAIIIFDSDWNPLSDLKILRRISIDSHCSQVKVFRLYTPYTLEEKVLLLAKQDMAIESSVDNISTKLRHSLLSWGASYLFGKLKEFYKLDRSSDCCQTPIDSFLVNDVLYLLTPSPGDVNFACRSNRSMIVEAQHSGTSYSSKITLLGEKENIPLSIKANKDPAHFWSKLLNAKYLKGKFTFGPSERTRRRSHVYDELAKIPGGSDEVREEYSDTDHAKKPEVESDQVRKKCKTAGVTSQSTWLDVGKEVEGVQIQNERLEEVHAGKRIESSDNLPLSASGYKPEKYNSNGQSGADEDAGDTTISSGSLSDSGARPVVSIGVRGESTEVAVVVPNGGMEDMPKELEIPDCQSKSTVAREPIEPSRILLDIPATVLCARADYEPQEVESTTFQKDIVNATGEEQNAVSSDAATPAVGIEPHAAADSRGICLTSSSLQSQTDPSCAPESELPGRGNEPYNQVPFVTERETFAVCGSRSEQAFTSAQNMVIPTVPSGNGQVIQGALDSHSLETSDPMLQIPPSTGLMSFMPSQARAPSLQEVLTQPIEKSNNSPSQSFPHPMPLLRNVPPDSNLPVHSTVPLLVSDQELHPDPFHNELVKLCKEEQTITRDHEEKKLQLQSEYEQEMDKLKRKYDSLIQNAETEFIHRKQQLEKIINSVHYNQILAEEFRSNFCKRETEAASVSQGTPSSYIQHTPQFMQPEVAQRTPLASISTPAPTSSHYISPLQRQPVPGAVAASAPLLLQPVSHTSAVINYFARHQSSPSLQPLASRQAGIFPRMPAPHLRPFTSSSHPHPNLPT